METRILVAVALILAVVLLGPVLKLVVGRWRAARIRAAGPLLMPQTGGTLAQPGIILLTGVHCGACASQKRVVETVRQAWPSPLSVRILDAVEHSDFSRRVGALIVPTTVVMTAAGTVVAVESGITTQERLMDHLAAAVA